MIYSKSDPQNIPWIKKFEVTVVEKSNHFKLQVNISSKQSSRSNADLIFSSNANSTSSKNKHWRIKNRISLINDSGKSTFDFKLNEKDLNKVLRLQVRYKENNEQHESERILLFSQVMVNLTDDTDNTALFPERKLDQYKNRIDTGVCFSGGGTRAMILAMGQMRYLHKKGYAKEIGYYSSVSGGSWAASIYGFAPQNNSSKLLGSYIDASESSKLINTSEVPEMAYGTKSLTFISNLLCSLAPLIKNKNKNYTNEMLSRWWIEAVGITFLAKNELSTPFSESLESFTLNNSSLQTILENQGSLQKIEEKKFRFMNTKRENGFYPPYYIANGLILRPTEGRNGMYIPYEYTPLYQGAGFDGKLDRSKLRIGGGNLPMFAFDTEVISKLKDGKVWVMRQNSNSLASLTTATGISSSAFAGATSSDGIINMLSLLKFLLSFVNSHSNKELQDQLNTFIKTLSEQLPNDSSFLKNWDYNEFYKNFTKKNISDTITFIIDHLDNLTPKANYFSPAQAKTTTENQLFNFGDAGLSDNFGLMALLRRKVKRIVVFVNTETEFNYQKSTPEIDTVIGAFFGMAQKDDPIQGIHLENMQVFDKALFKNLINDFKKCQEKGETLVSKNTLKVLPNKNWDVSGNYEVEILWHYNCRPKNWENEMDTNALEKLDTKGIQVLEKYSAGIIPPGKFPFYKTFPATLLGLNPFEINMLANIAEWNLIQTDDLLSEFLQIKEALTV
ncbi:hypothetical protein [Tenacibaculum xiamenense]|uniref:hypothetical protein n=1 Tax=Tenacibaculum xiamenense TaxID=1261553 RepID=UPI003892E49E